MDPIKIAMKAVQERYGLLGLPAVRSPQFLNLIRGTTQLMNVTSRVLGSRHYAKSLRVSHDKGAMAATDFKFNVTVPAWYCYPESLEKFFGRPLTMKENSAVALTLVNGSSIHEALHVALSRNIMTKYFANVLESHEQPKLFQYLVNVVEDVKIETRLRETDSEELITFVNCKNEIFFPNEKVDEIVTSTKSEFKDDPKSVALELLVAWKCVSRREKLRGILDSLGFNNVVEIFNSINSSTDTYAVAEQLFKIFKDAESSNKARSEADFNSEKSDSIEAMKTLSKHLKEHPEDAEFISADDEEHELSEADGSMKPLREVDVLHNEDGRHGHADVDLKFGFVKKLKVARQVIPSRSEPKTSGAKLLNHRLARIITDGKIFSNHGESIYSMSKDFPEFIILIDLSGSMGNLADTVIETARNMSKSMREVGIPHAIYGHTSHGEYDTPTVYHIYSYKTNGTSADFDSRFDSAHDIDLRQNYDGHAILHVAKKFNRKCKNRYLLVLSDGEPCAPHYHKAVGHTIECVNNVRKSGTKVIALSLKQEVIEDNNHIYGQKSNVDATTQASLESQMQQIILGT